MFIEKNSRIRKRIRVEKGVNSVFAIDRLQMPRVNLTALKSGDIEKQQLQALLRTAKSSSFAKQFAMELLKDKYPKTYEENFGDQVDSTRHDMQIVYSVDNVESNVEVMDSDDENLSELKAIPEEMLKVKEDKKIDLLSHRPEINFLVSDYSSDSDSDSDSDEDYFVLPASGIVLNQPPPLPHRQTYFHPLLTNKCKCKCRRRLFY